MTLAHEMVDLTKKDKSPWTHMIHVDLFFTLSYVQSHGAETTKQALLLKRQCDHEIME